MKTSLATKAIHSLYTQGFIDEAESFLASYIQSLGKQPDVSERENKVTLRKLQEVVNDPDKYQITYTGQYDWHDVHPTIICNALMYGNIEIREKQSE